MNCQLERQAYSVHRKKKSSLKNSLNLQSCLPQYQNTSLQTFKSLKTDACHVLCAVYRVTQCKTIKFKEIKVLQFQVFCIITVSHKQEIFNSLSHLVLPIKTGHFSYSKSPLAYYLIISL